MTSLEVRPAVVVDVEKLTLIWQEHMHDLAKLDRRFRITEDAPVHYRNDLQAWLGREDARVLVAERDGRLIGFVVGWRVKRPPVQTPEMIGLISDLCVDGHARQGGVGSALLDGLRGWFKDHQIEVVEAHVPQSHPIAQAFWRALGATDYLHVVRYRL